MIRAALLVAVLCAGCSAAQLRTATMIGESAARVLRIGSNIAEATNKIRDSFDDPEGRVETAQRLVAEAMQLAATNEPEKVAEAAEYLRKAVTLGKLAVAAMDAQGRDVPGEVRAAIEIAEGGLAAHAIDQGMSAASGGE